MSVPVHRTCAAFLAAIVAASVIAPPQAEAGLKCKNVSKRFQVCGDAKPFKKLVVGVGIRFSKKKPGLSAGSRGNRTRSRKQLRAGAISLTGSVQRTHKGTKL
jgi:hypothetical protein